MNLLLLKESELQEARCLLCAADPRLSHMQHTLAVKVGDTLRAGVLHRSRGLARVLEIDRTHALLAYEATDKAEAPGALTVLLALPRPQTLRKVLFALPQLGVGCLLLCRSARVEKSYFQSKLLQDGEWRRHLQEGMMQAACVRQPEVLLVDRFRPAVEDWLPELIPTDSLRVLPHPGSCDTLKSFALYKGGPVCIALGPEGGWVPFEVDLLGSQGFHTVSLGERILRVETALPVVAGQLHLLAQL